MSATETHRQLIHAGMALWIVVLRWLTPAEAVAVAAAAIVLNWVVLPLTGLDRRMRREGEPFVTGVKLYPVAVCAALLLFPYPLAALAWAVLGIGDAASNVIGRRFGSGPFLGRTDRSLAGTLGFVATAAPAALAAAAWVDVPGTYDLMAQLLPASLVAALAGAAMEYVRWPRPLDDNLPIALAAGGAAWGAIAVLG